MTRESKVYGEERMVDSNPVEELYETDELFNKIVTQLESVGWKVDRWGHLQRGHKCYGTNETTRYRIVFNPRVIRIEQRTSFGTWNRIRSIRRSTASISDFGWHGEPLSVMPWHEKISK